MRVAGQHEAQLVYVSTLDDHRHVNVAAVNENGAVAQLVKAQRSTGLGVLALRLACQLPVQKYPAFTIARNVGSVS